MVSGAGIERTLKVVQAGAGSMLTFDSPAYAQAAGETIAVAVTTNVEYTVSMPADREWIENVTSSPQELKFRVTENDGMQPRSASIVVAAKDVPNLRRTLVVEQQGRGAAINIDGPQEITLAYDDTELALNVTANVAYRIAFEYETPGTEWIWSMETRAMTMKKEEFALNRNMGAEPRTAIVHFISEGVSPVIMRDVSITQDGHEGLDDSIFELWNTSELRTVSYSKQNIAVSIRTGKQPEQITLGQLPEWIVQDGATASTAETLIYTFAVDENRWPLARNHEITFAANGVTLTVNLRQDSAPVSYQTVDYNSLTGSFTGGSFGTLCDFDLSTSLTGELPGDWIFAGRIATHSTR